VSEGNNNIASGRCCRQPFSQASAAGIEPVLRHCRTTPAGRTHRHWWQSHRPPQQGCSRGDLWVGFIDNLLSAFQTSSRQPIPPSAPSFGLSAEPRNRTIRRALAARVGCFISRLFDFALFEKTIWSLKISIPAPCHRPQRRRRTLAPALVLPSRSATSKALSLNQRLPISTA